MQSQAAPGSPKKKLESRNAQRVVRLLAIKLKPLGFQRTKSSIFARLQAQGIEFVHVHKFSFAPTFRVHFGIRIRTDEFPGAHLNGPSSDEMVDPEDPNRRRYRFDFDADESSLEACAEDLCQCVLAEGLAWFAAIRKPGFLLSSKSPLTPDAHAALRRELEFPASVQASEATQRVFNAAALQKLPPGGGSASRS